MSIFSNINFFRDYEPPSDYKDFLKAGILGFVVGDAAGLPFDGMRREELTSLQNKMPELIKTSRENPRLQSWVERR